jgi:superfamily II DNA or RNA helicase
MISEKPFEDEKFIHPFGEIEVIEENYESEKKIKDLGIEKKLKKATSKFVEKFKKKFKRTKELCLSETQKEAIKKLEKKFEMGHKRLLLDLEAGSGKTIVALEVAFNRMKSLIGDQDFFENQVFPFAMEKTPSSLQGAGILIVVNSTHLTNQFIGEIKKFYPDSFVGTEEDFIFQFQAKSTASRMQDPLKLFKDNHESCLPFRAENISSSSFSFVMKKKQKKDVVPLFQIEEEQEENEQENEEEVEEEIIEENGEVNSKKKHGFKYVIDWSKMNIRRVVQKKIEGFVLIVTSQRITNARKGSYLNWLYLRIPNLFSTIIYDEAQMFAKIGVGHWLFSSIIDSNPHAKVLALSGTFFRNDWYDIYGQASLLKLKKVYEGKIFEWAKRRFWVELGKKDKEESDSIWVEHFIKEFVVTNQINPQLFSELQKKFINRNISSSTNTSTNSSNISASEVESMDEKEEKKKEKNDDDEEEKQERVLNHEVSQLRQFVPVKIDLISMDLDDRDGCSKNYYTFVSNWFEHLISLKRQRDQQMKQKSLFKKVITIPSVNHLILPFTSILQMTLLHPY